MKCSSIVVVAVVPPRIKVFPKKLTGPQLVKKFPAISRFLIPAVFYANVGGWVRQNTCVSGCGVCTGCCAECDCTTPRTHTTTWNTCCHNTALLITTYFYWLFLQKCNFSQAQREFPGDGPNGPKHVAANIRYFNVNFNILYV